MKSVSSLNSPYCPICWLRQTSGFFKAYAHKLIDAGVPVTATTYLGTTHDFVRANQLADTPAAHEAISQASDILKEHLWK